MIPHDATEEQLAGLLLSIAYRTGVLESVWRPWLEGIAMYVELLCDPNEDPEEILPVFEAIRSLTDSRVRKFHEESKEEFTERFAAENTALYENFHSE